MMKSDNGLWAVSHPMNGAPAIIAAQSFGSLSLLEELQAAIQQFGHLPLNKATGIASTTVLNESLQEPT